MHLLEGACAVQASVCVPPCESGMSGINGDVKLCELWMVPPSERGMLDVNGDVKPCKL